MGNKNVEENPFTQGQQRRRRLSNITNLSLSPSWLSNSRPDLVKSNDFQLREENAALKRLLSEKEATLQQVQQDFLSQLRRQSQVNEEIISYNSRLSKEVGQLRDQLRLLQHRHCQMTVAYRTNQSELRVKLAESQEQLATLLRDMESKRSTSCNAQRLPSKLSKNLIRSKSQRHSGDGSFAFALGNGLECSHMPSSVRRSLDEKTTRSIRFKREEKPTTDVRYSQRHINRCTDFTGLECMVEGIEDDHPQESVTGSLFTDEEPSRSLNSTGDAQKIRRPKNVLAASVPTMAINGTKALETSVINLVSSETQRVASISSSTSIPHFSRRGSETRIGRLVRKSVTTVASYKEPSLNIKMRRS